MDGVFLRYEEYQKRTTDAVAGVEETPFQSMAEALEAQGLDVAGLGREVTKGERALQGGSRESGRLRSAQKPQSRTVGIITRCS